MRLIDADALIEFIDMGHLRNPLESCFSERDVVDMLESRPTIDAVPVVRCRERKHWKKGEFQAGDDVMHLEYGGYCPNCRFARYESDFCSYGERKEGAD